MSEQNTTDPTQDEIAAIFGGPVGPVVLTPAERAEIELVIAYVDRNGHQP